MSQTSPDTSVQFSLVSSGVPLYRTEPAPAAGAPQLFYALVGSPAAFPASLTAAEAWASQSGAFLFLPPDVAIPDAAGLVAALNALLAPLVSSRQWLLWLPSGEAGAVGRSQGLVAINKAAGPGDGHVVALSSQAAAVAFANLVVALSSGLVVQPQFDAAVPGLAFAPNRQAGTTIVLQQPATGSSVAMPTDALMTLPFAGSGLGTLRLPLNGDRGLFYALFTPGDGSESPPASAECRFFHATAGSPKALRFPLLLGSIPNPAAPPSERLPLAVSIDPLRPFDDRRTRFVFDLPAYGGNGPVLPTSFAFRTTAGTILTLTPQAGAGFGLGLRPDGDSGTAAYLTPAGPYALAKPVGRAAGNPPLANGALELMCGVYGTEFLLVADGDGLDFTGGRPAHAARFQAPPTLSAVGDGPLSDAFTTSWARVIPGPKTDVTFPGAIKQSFCAQAFGSVYYQTRASNDLPLPVAIGARIADLSDPAAGQVLPIAPFGLVFYSDDIVKNPNPNVTGDDLVSFDATVLSRARFAALAPDCCLGPMFFDMARIEALAGGSVRTPQGLLVELNDGPLDGSAPAGTWKNLTLAQSPQQPGQVLAFRAGTSPSGCRAGKGPYEIVSPYLSTALMDPAAVLFLAKRDKLGTFDDLLQLGEYPIRLAVSNASAGTNDDPLGDNCVCIFKFSTDRALSDLAGDPSGWGSAGDLTGDPDAVARISAQVVATIALARAESEAAIGDARYDYFADFLARVSDPAWTGVIALNPPLEQQSLSPDVQMLLCGMRKSGGLRCHHFGITGSSVAGAGAATTIDKSALFALVRYVHPFQSDTVALPFDFQTLRLDALFDNSVVKNFDSQVAVSLATVMGNPAALSGAAPQDRPASNTIVIDGVLQVADGVTRVVFVTRTPRAFTMPKNGSAYRVVGKQTIAKAGLAPVTRDDAATTADLSPTVTVTARFTLDGALGFNTRAVDGTTADLFSYGLEAEEGGGLGYNSYALTLVSQVPPGGQTPPPVITLALDAMLLDAADGSPRQASLIATLPLRVTSFVTRMPGSSRSAPVDGIGLDGVTPTYALSTELAMGTLGGLSDAGPLEGQLLLGWVPGGDDAVADRTGALLAAPPAMTGGSFRLQGVIPSTYGRVELLRPTLNGKDVYVLVIHDVQFMLGAFGLYIPSMGERSLTFFGKPDEGAAALGQGEDENEAATLSWFLGKPDLSSTIDGEGPRVALNSATPALSFTPAVYVLAGLKVRYDQQASSVVDEVIGALSDVPLSTKAALDDILAGKVSIPVDYDPHAGVTVAVALEFGPVAFKFVFSDPYVYGGYLAISKPGDGDSDGAGEGARRVDVVDPPPEKKKGILSSLEGFALEIAYRKISDGLGAWSASFTITGHIGTDDYYLMLPTIGLVIYTNNDFRIDIGWPFAPEGGGAQPIAVQFAIEGVPLRASAGLYLAKLRSKDAPGVLGADFSVIWRFGLGLAFGLNKDVSKGPMSLSAGLIAFVTFEGFLGSTSGRMTEGGVDYKWFAGQLGARAYFSGAVDLKVVMIGVSAVATLVLQVAYETNHKTVIRLAFRLSIAVEFRVLFFKVSFSFDADLDVFPPIEIGAGPAASIEGPDPNGQNSLVFEVTPGPRPHKAVAHGLLALHAEDGERLTVPLHFVLQPTTLNGATAGSAAPQAVATLLINLLPDETGTDDFSRFASVLAGWLVATYGGTGTLSARLTAVASALAAGTVDDAIGGFLAANVFFRIEASDTVDAATNYAAFPMLAPLMVTYGATSTRFDTPALPATYPADAHAYFRQLAPQVKPAAALAALDDGAPSMAGVVCSDMIVLMARQLVSQLQDVVRDHPDDTLRQALQGLGPHGFANVAGVASRFAFNGVRLPTPDSRPFGSALAGLYALTGQQIALQQTEGAWQLTFGLQLAPGQVAPWIGFGASGADVSITDVLDANLVLTQPVVPTWLSSGRGFTVLPPLRREVSVFYLGQAVTWTAAGKSAAAILPLGNALLRRLATTTAGGGTNVTATIRQTDAVPARSLEAKLAERAPLSAVAALFVPIALRQITPPGAGVPLASVFQLIGTDDATRPLVEMLVRAPVAGTSVSFVLSAGDGIYATPAAEDDIVLAKADLSTLNQPPSLVGGRFVAAVADQPPVSARLGDVTAFLTLVWEESVTHGGGFFFHLADVPADAFANGDAPAALVVRTSAAAGTAVPLAPWCNVVIPSNAPAPREGALTATVDDSGGAWSQAAPNLAAGAAGFEVTWPRPPAQPALDARSTLAQKAAYAEALYSLLQYRVMSLGGSSSTAVTLPTNWSLPVGPNQAERDGDWIFDGTVAVAPLLGAANRYAGTGSTVGFGVALLDLYGNQLPTDYLLDAPVVYNDALLGLDQWPGARGYYAFARGAAGKVTLILSIDFDPKRLGTGSQTETDPAVLRSALAVYRTVLDQLTDPVQAGRSGAGARVATVFAAQPLTSTASGASLTEGLASWVGLVLSWLEAAVPGEPTPPAAFYADFALDLSAPTRLASDLTPLAVDLVIARDPATLSTPVVAALPSVAKVNSTLGAAVGLAAPAERRTDSDPDMQLEAFARAFETAWYGFDGGTAQLKLAQGLAGAGTPSAALALWFVRVGAGAGIGVTVPNAGTPGPADLPVALASPPLSTVLVSKSEKVRSYGTNWSGGGDDISSDHDQAFVDIDMTAWAIAALGATEALFGPDMATAAATLEAGRYASLATTKQRLADAIAPTLRPVLIVPGQTRALDVPRERFRQALLENLSSAYALAAVVDVPTRITLAGTDEPTAPPNLYGRPTGSGLRDTGGRQPYSLSPAALRLAQGPSDLVYLVSSRTADARAWLDTELTYEVAFLEHDRRPGQKIYGYEPSSWLSFVVPDFRPDADGAPPALGIGLGRTAIPLPLRVYPPMPAIATQAAVLPAAPATVAEALRWAYRCTVVTPQAPQDELLLSVILNDPPSPPSL